VQHSTLVVHAVPVCPQLLVAGAHVGGLPVQTVLQHSASCVHAAPSVEHVASQIVSSG
jgi:hypothetical protein